MAKKKSKTPVNANPYKDLPLKTELKIKDLEVYVAIQNAGMTWFSPTKAEEDFSKDQSDKFVLRGLVIFKADTDGAISDCYNWSRV